MQPSGSIRGAILSFRRSELVCLPSDCSRYLISSHLISSRCNAMQSLSPAGRDASEDRWPADKAAAASTATASAPGPLTCRGQPASTRARSAREAIKEWNDRSKGRLLRCGSPSALYPHGPVLSSLHTLRSDRPRWQPDPAKSRSPRQLEDPGRICPERNGFGDRTESVSAQIAQ